jgi:predicted RNA binding protein YcfA (HicA-like mRNA interferase family)
VQNIREAIVLHLESFQTANNPKMFIDGATIPQVAKFLQGQCFVPLRKSGNHLTLYNHLNIVITVPIHKVPELGRKLILRVLKEAGCSPNDFLK